MRRLKRSSVCCWRGAVLGHGPVCERCKPAGWGRKPKRRTDQGVVCVYSVSALGECVMRKPDRQATVGSVLAGMPDNDFAAEYPTITDYLTCIRYEDGSARVVSALSLFLEEGSCKVALNDKDCKRSLYVAADTFKGALVLLEAALQTDAAPWRQWNGKRK
jgi:hypothetical protein